MNTNGHEWPQKAQESQIEFLAFESCGLVVSFCASCGQTRSALGLFSDSPGGPGQFDQQFLQLFPVSIGRERRLAGPEFPQGGLQVELPLAKGFQLSRGWLGPEWRNGLDRLRQSDLAGQ